MAAVDAPSRKLAARKEAPRFGCALLGAAWVWILALSSLRPASEWEDALVALGKASDGTFAGVSPLERTLAEVLSVQPLFWAVASIGVAFSADTNAPRVLLWVQTAIGVYVVRKVMSLSLSNGAPDRALFNVALGGMVFAVAGSLCILLDLMQTFAPPPTAAPRKPAGNAKPKSS